MNRQEGTVPQGLGRCILVVIGRCNRTVSRNYWVEHHDERACHNHHQKLDPLYCDGD